MSCLDHPLAKLYTFFLTRNTHSHLALALALALSLSLSRSNARVLSGWG